VYATTAWAAPPPGGHRATTTPAPSWPATWPTCPT